MLLAEVYARFYKSFNYDFLRKFHPDSKAKPWETIGAWFPYVRVPIESDITTIVGANESGKSHLLSALEKGLGERNINPEDFCRYSDLYTLRQGRKRWPDFGFKWIQLSSEEQEILTTSCESVKHDVFEHFFWFREERDRYRLFLLNADSNELQERTLKEGGIEAISKLLPSSYRINPDIALPGSVPIRWLASDEASYKADPQFERKQRVSLLDALFNMRPHFESTESIKSHAAQLAEALSPFRTTHGKESKRLTEQYRLARDLICLVADITPDSFDEVRRAIGENLDGHVNGIVAEVNRSLARVLNFPKWWAQDSAFSLKLDVREHDVVFTVKDRTLTDYSFDERSSGLKYFLSYYIQHLAHRPKDGRREILLMDEPDAFLSSQAQQDLLKIFEEIAHPTRPGAAPIQVIYVTHSPFLINRNHGSRIRVLSKGERDEGTRVVRNASRNHYEPLRSALGAYVAETTFIGNCNLMVEGPADQVLLAGAATLLKALGHSDYHTLDLNTVTIVPAGSAQHVPYLVYLARGRDYDRPAVMALLDSDTEGDKAKAQLLGQGPMKRSRLRAELILQVGEVAQTLRQVPSQMPKAIEIEDLIPLAICIDATKEYFSEIGVEGVDFTALTRDTVLSHADDKRSCFDAIEAACININPALHIDKIGFARGVLRVVSALHTSGPTESPFKDYVLAMRVLFERLATMRRVALAELGEEAISAVIDRKKRAFIQDHDTSARREEAVSLLDSMATSLDDSIESEETRLAMERLKRNFKLAEDVMTEIPDYVRFREELERIRYAGHFSARQN